MLQHVVGRSRLELQFSVFSIGSVKSKPSSSSLQQAHLTRISKDVCFRRTNGGLVVGIGRQKIWVSSNDSPAHAVLVMNATDPVILASVDRSFLAAAVRCIQCLDAFVKSIFAEFHRLLVTDRLVFASVVSVGIECHLHEKLGANDFTNRMVIAAVPDKTLSRSHTTIMELALNLKICNVRIKPDDSISLNPAFAGGSYETVIPAKPTEGEICLGIAVCTECCPPLVNSMF